MTFRVKRMYAIFQKDLKDLSKNMYIGSTVFMAVLLAALYGRMDGITLELHFMVINMTFAIVTGFIQCAIIAEEKEKNTLRGLMLSPATISEIMAGKSLVSFITTIVTLIICMWLTGYTPASILPIAIAIILSIFFYIAMGTLLGLLSKSVMEASVIVLPVLFIFGFGSFLVGFIDEYPVLKVIEYFPNVQIIDLAYKVEEGLGFGDIWSHLGVIMAWVVVTALITIVVFKKREMDE
ncbi:ABC transporter permease [Oceanobacillus bengalensis]|uniref:ABC transporter permease n=1 Tax=Oceanobacillus bengalensis TaxID=1435466 RepID=A0A494Z2T9_9BACI|nr:ABC transporter permease [Oceanobacillus bengalensis]RKQ16811.1 ABC transporter permease [Oceanobacillus bengalensis]